jgi:hypothetical protein
MSSRGKKLEDFYMNILQSFKPKGIFSVKLTNGNMLYKGGGNQFEVKRPVLKAKLECQESKMKG